MNTNKLAIAASTPILDTLSSVYFASLEDLFGIDVKPLDQFYQEQETFVAAGPAIGEIHFVGSVAGFIAISATPGFFAKVFDLVDAPHPTLVNPLKEVLNTVAGKCLKILLKEYSVVTLLAPKVTLGEVYYPKVPCYSKMIDTSYGQVCFHLSIDQMKLDVSRLVDKIDDSERKSQRIIEYLQFLFSNLEKTQTQIMTEVSLTINNIKVLEELLAKEEGTSTDISSDLSEALNLIANIKNMVIRKLNDTIYDLKHFKNLLLNHLLINKQYPNERQLDVMLAGTLTEQCDLGFLENFKGDLININTKNLLHFTAKGVARWLKVMRDQDANVKIQFTGCSAEFLDAAQQYDGILRGGEVFSVSVGFTCDDCHQRKPIDVEIDHHKVGANRLAEVYCGCSKQMSCSEEHESILRYFAK